MVDCGPYNIFPAKQLYLFVKLNDRSPCHDQANRLLNVPMNSRFVPRVEGSFPFVIHVTRDPDPFSVIFNDPRVIKNTPDLFQPPRGRLDRDMSVHAVWQYQVRWP
jgi:hypothetical protein